MWPTLPDPKLALAERPLGTVKVFSGGSLGKDVAAVSAMQGGIGRTIALSLAEAGFDVALTAVRLGGAGIGVYEVIPGLIATAMSSVSKARYDADIKRG